MIEGLSSGVRTCERFIQCCRARCPNSAAQYVRHQCIPIMGYRGDSLAPGLCHSAIPAVPSECGKVNERLWTGNKVPNPIKVSFLSPPSQNAPGPSSSSFDNPNSEAQTGQPSESSSSNTGISLLTSKWACVVVSGGPFAKAKREPDSITDEVRTKREAGEEEEEELRGKRQPCTTPGCRTYNSFYGRPRTRYDYNFLSEALFKDVEWDWMCGSLCTSDVRALGVG